MSNLVEKISIGDMFARATNGSERLKIAYLDNVWNKANEVLFGNQLSSIRIELMRDMGPKTRTFGQYSYSRKVIRIAPRLFLAGEAYLLETMVHEMCHQADREVDNNFCRKNGGHGYNWSKWMVQCGLDPRRFSGEDKKLATMTDSEREQRAARIETIKTRSEERGRPAYFQTGMVVAYADRSGRLIPVRLVAKNGRNSDRWQAYILSYPRGDRWSIVPMSIMVNATDDEKALFDSEPAIAGYNQVERSVAKNVEISRKNRATRAATKRFLNSL